jgi:polysaccharide biosynthesis/export protein
MGKKKFNIVYTFFWIMIILNISCVPYNKVRYFTDINQIAEPSTNPRGAKLIMPFDNLYIKVMSTDEQTARIFNISENAGGNLPLNLISYTVDEKGNISFPFTGDINVKGLTIDQASEKIQTALNDYISKTSIIVRFVENNISILGEVQRPGVVNFVQDKLNIYEALSLGGGLTRYGDRKNVVLIRQEGDKIVHYKLDLSNSTIANRDYYYIVPNDVIVVEPLRAIAWSYNNVTFSTALTAITSLLSLFLIFYIPLNN